MANPKIIYTLGTSNRTIDEFLAILHQYNIKGIIDVRRFPKSSRYPYFNREELSGTLEKSGITYLWIGEALGGFRNGGYEKYRQEPAYKKGLEQVKEVAATLNVALVCAEKLPWKCHRLQISMDLEMAGWKIIHIIDKDKTWTPVWSQRA